MVELFEDVFDPDRVYQPSRFCNNKIIISSTNRFDGRETSCIDVLFLCGKIADSVSEQRKTWVEKHGHKNFVVAVILSHRFHEKPIFANPQLARAILVGDNSAFHRSVLGNGRFGKRRFDFVYYFWSGRFACEKNSFEPVTIQARCGAVFCQEPDGGAISVHGCRLKS